MKSTESRKERRKERYKRIYDQFIADRQLKVKALLASGAFVHRHHIVPSCMGGGDEKENMIPLTVRDHNWAHIFLARAHDGGPYSRDLWLSVIGTFGMLSAQEGYTFTKREIELRALAGEEAGKAMMGEGNPMYGRTGELAPMYGKGHLVAGEKNPRYGKGLNGEDNGMYGKTHSNESKDVLSITKKEAWALVMLAQAYGCLSKKKEDAQLHLKTYHSEVLDYFLALPDVDHRQAYARAHKDPNEPEFKLSLYLVRSVALTGLAVRHNCQTLKRWDRKGAIAFLEANEPQALQECLEQFNYEDDLIIYYRQQLEKENAALLA